MNPSGNQRRQGERTPPAVHVPRAVERGGLVTPVGGRP